MKTFLILSFGALIFFSLNILTLDKARAFNILTTGLSGSGNIDFDKFCKEMLNIYASDEVHVKKERLAFKKLNDMLDQTFTFKMICSDSIAFDKKEYKTTIKSREVYYSDNKAGYFGIFVIVNKNGDELLMSSTPDKEITITGKITDLLVLQYKSSKGLYPKCRTSLKDFDDAGTEIQQILLLVDA